MQNREPESSPNCHNDVLLHVCCAPCSAAVIEAIQAMGKSLTVLFYNPNIHPEMEYERRKNEIMRYAEKLAIALIDADYDSARWFAQTHGLENAPERGVRCTVCFDMRLEFTAQYASTYGFSVFATSLGISRWKNLQQINDCGQRAAARYPKLSFWDCNWRKGGGTTRMHELNKRENFYMQEYCGCTYSLRETLLRRSSM